MPNVSNVNGLRQKLSDIVGIFCTDTHFFSPNITHGKQKSLRRYRKIKI